MKLLFLINVLLYTRKVIRVNNQSTVPVISGSYSSEHAPHPSSHIFYFTNDDWWGPPYQDSLKSLMTTHSLHQSPIISINLLSPGIGKYKLYFFLLRNRALVYLKYIMYLSNVCMYIDHRDLVIHEYERTNEMITQILCT